MTIIIWDILLDLFLLFVANNFLDRYWIFYFEGNILCCKSCILDDMWRSSDTIDYYL